MATTQEILTRISAAKPEAPTGAFAVEINSNADVEGNLNSKHMYNQTKDTNNGLQKMAENVYLEKIARMQQFGNWAKNLGTSFKNAEPLTQVGATSSALGLGLSASKLSADRKNAQENEDRKHVERESLQTLRSINRSLNKAVVLPSSVIKKASLSPLKSLTGPKVQNYGAQALGRINKSLSTSSIAPSKIAVQRPKGRV